MTLQDSGERTRFPSGAQRDRSAGKGRFDLIEPEILFRLAKHYEAGAAKYNDRNWEKGIPISCLMDSAFRHLAKYLQGWADEDHLAAVLWNIGCIMRFEKDGRKDLLDLPWQGKPVSPEGGEVIRIPDIRPQTLELAQRLMQYMQETTRSQGRASAMFDGDPQEQFKKNLGVAQFDAYHITGQTKIQFLVCPVCGVVDELSRPFRCGVCGWAEDCEPSTDSDPQSE